MYLSVEKMNVSSEASDYTSFITIWLSQIIKQCRQYRIFKSSLASLKSLLKQSEIVWLFSANKQEKFWNLKSEHRGIEEITHNKYEISCLSSSKSLILIFGEGRRNMSFWRLWLPNGRCARHEMRALLT